MVARIIQQFEVNNKPKLQKYQDYYKGEQPILRKMPSDTGKPCNRIVTNYCYNIVQNYLGYITGIDIVYQSPNKFEQMQDILDYNDVRTEDNELLRQALIFGVSYEINYLDEEGKQRFKLLDPREVIPVYSNDLNSDLLYVIRYYEADLVNNNDAKKYIIEVYSQGSTAIYESFAGFSTFSLLEERENYYNQVPITVFALNTDQESIFDKVMTLQDAYNNLLSGEVDDFESWSDAYLVLKGVAADAEVLDDCKRKRAFMIDSDCDISYLTKSVSDTQIENMLKNVNDTIHKIANSPDFNDDKFMSQSGIAMRYKLTGFENVASNIVANMTKALQKRLELIDSILHTLGDDSSWREVEIVFTRNLPVNTLEIAQMVNQLRGLVSDATLLTQIPFVGDIQKELELLNEQKEAQMALYNFDTENPQVQNDNEDEVK